MEEKLSKKEARKVFLQNHKMIRNESLDGFVVLKNINKIYDNHVQAVYDFNLSIKPNEFIVLVGPSGCGKSTTLRMIAGLEDITSGYLYIDHVLANHLESKDRNIAMVFQSYALYPQMSVYDNIAFGLKVQKMPKEEIRKKVYEAAKILNLGPYLDRKPKELSGGQMQRVALGRAIVRDAKLFLMDEPLSNLDAKLRVHMRSEIVKIHNSVHATTVYVTHDQTEAMTMADRIVVMNKGFVQQIGTPKEIYDHPKNIFVATFIGTPPMNLLNLSVEGNIAKDGEHALTLPGKYIEAYDRFVRRKIAFFESLKNCVDTEREQALCCLIEDFLHGKKNISADEIVSRLEELEKAKELFASRYASLRENILNTRESSDRLENALSDALRVLKEVRYDVEALFKKIDSAGITSRAEKENIREKKKRKFGFLFGKKSDSQEKTKEQFLIDQIEAFIQRYEEQLKEKRSITVGIRPEDIYIADECKGTKSDEIRIRVTFSELMGSEYYVHTDLFGEEIILKLDTDRLLRIGDEISIALNIDKLKIFDRISGENILWKEG